MKKNNFKKCLFYHVGLMIIHEFCQGCKTYHFLVKSIQKNFFRWTRSSDTLARNSAKSKYAALNVKPSLQPLHPLPPPPQTRTNFLFGSKWATSATHYIPYPPPPLLESKLQKWSEKIKSKQKRIKKLLNLENDERITYINVLVCLCVPCKVPFCNY